MIRLALIATAIALAPSAQAGDADRCMAVATLALRSASAAEAGVTLVDFAGTLPDLPRSMIGIILVAYGLYLIDGDAPRMIAAEIYDGCMGEDA